MHGNEMNEGDFPYSKVFKIEIQKGYQTVQSFCRIDSPPKKLGPSSIICGKYKKVRKALLNHVKCMEMWWMM